MVFIVIWHNLFLFFYCFFMKNHTRNGLIKSREVPLSVQDACPTSLQ
ncbi:hypothetical protein HMPREF3226_00219 [Prevotella corporis]|uniref:Uncharacterized protein n=1 Tax=Prevotella corporis TaxID=28128 RepID=A0A133QN49_9BACT|nr:hypothetical protein HMPREF3226_00219 [Prevotella corporis]